MCRNGTTKKRLLRPRGSITGIENTLTNDVSYDRMLPSARREIGYTCCSISLAITKGQAMKFLTNRLSALAIALAAINPLAITSTAALSVSTFTPATIVSTTVIAGGALTLSGTQAKACGDGSCDPKPEPPKTDTKTVHDGRDAVCPTNSYEASVLKKVEGLAVGEDVTVRDGDRTVIKRGGDYEVVKVLSSRRVCVQKERTTVTTVAPAAEKRQCDEQAAARELEVCPEGVYTGKYTRKAN